MRILVAAVVAAVSAVAGAQSMEMAIDSPWAVWDSSVSHTVSAQLMRRDSVTGDLEAVAGQRVTIGALSFRTLEIKAQFPGQKTTPLTAAGVRLYHEASGTGWRMPQHQVNVTFPADLVVPAGRGVACVYSMPLIGKGKLTCWVT